MSKRIITISTPARLSLRHQQIIISRNNEKDVSVPVEDLGLCILENPAISYTQAVLTACAQQNIFFIVCDNRHLPVATLLPLIGHTLQSKVLTQQAAASKPALKKLWQKLVQAKILAQAQVLSAVKSPKNLRLQCHAKEVKSGDPENKEAQAARIYWPALFGENFQRDPSLAGINQILNYGYAIMRAAIARAIVGTGLHPSLGIHHHNQYNPFCLADDLLEPLRPWVDYQVYNLNKQSCSDFILTKDMVVFLTCSYR